jgi:hypothetical protein
VPTRCFRELDTASRHIECNIQNVKCETDTHPPHRWRLKHMIVRATLSLQCCVPLLLLLLLLPAVSGWAAPGR